MLVEACQCRTRWWDIGGSGTYSAALLAEYSIMFSSLRSTVGDLILALGSTKDSALSLEASSLFEVLH